MWTKLRRWLRRPKWSLRTFFVAFLILAALTGWFARKCHLARQSPVALLGNVTNQPSESPSDDDILRRLRQSNRVGSDFHLMQILRHPAASHVDPPRMIPLLGPASLHHAPFWCVVVGREGWMPCLDVVFIDHNYFELARHEAM